MKRLCAVLVVTLLVSTSVVEARHRYHHYRHYGFRAGTAAAMHFQNKFNKDY